MEKTDHGQNGPDKTDHVLGQKLTMSQDKTDRASGQKRPRFSIFLRNINGITFQDRLPSHIDRHILYRNKLNSENRIILMTYLVRLE